MEFVSAIVGLFMTPLIVIRCAQLFFHLARG
jgi:hypothetical protein